MPEHLEQVVIDKAQGNPFFLEELTRAVIEPGGTAASIDVPDTIQGVLSARIDRLPEEHKRLLQIASVLGREFSPRLLAAMWDGTGSLEPWLLELKRLEFLFERTGVGESTYIFKHALTQEVAYESLLVTRRQVLHAAAGDAMERLYPDWLADRYEALAHHFTRGAVWAKAFDYLTKSGEKARQAQNFKGRLRSLTSCRAPRSPSSNQVLPSSYSTRLASTMTELCLSSLSRPI